MRAGEDLCDHCMGRAFMVRAGASDAGILGRRLRREGGYAEPARCAVCRGLFARLGEHCDEMVRLAGATEFATFLVGATLRPSVLDADDSMRSRHGLRGTPGIKSDVTRTLSRMFARRTRARAEASSPDMTLKVDLRDGAVSIETRPVHVAARYTKESRELPQRQGRCESCGGRGCVACGRRGISGTCSVEGRLAEFLCGAFGARQARFTWCGTEERGGTVSGRGRPFFARLSCPSRREARLPRRADLGGVTVIGARAMRSPPGAAPRFVLTASLSVRAEEDIGDEALGRLRALRGGVTDYGSRMQRRAIHSASVRRSSPREFALTLRVDGGFPIRRFVEGPDVSPNVSDTLEVRCSCERADFADVDIRPAGRGGARSG
ncbi:MAG: hypothetical protein OXU37_08200 [Thaumarchaeota archaeon]|nr:hypothetical protein [Nitrososphaerota archaeon]